MTKRGGLGRGLAALIPTSGAAPAPVVPPAASPTVDDTVAAGPELPPTDADVEARVEAVEPVPGLALREIPLGEIEANPQQPRQAFDEEALAPHAPSLPAVGRQPPGGGRPPPDHSPPARGPIRGSSR
ncbi:MAG: hypothetical protein WKF51_12165 [Geodermatophilaceae bacterium]